MTIYMTCPFCGDNDFDAVGLKGHLLNGSCEVFEATETPMQERLRLECGRDRQPHPSSEGGER